MATEKNVYQLIGVWLFCLLLAPTVKAIPAAERDALEALYTSTSGDSWTNNDNWLSGDPCTWFGIQCEGSAPDERVTGIFLSSNGLAGSVPPELSGLAQLSSINLGENELTGPLPVELGALTSLTDLDLSNNQLSGAIPAEIGDLTELFALDLAGNQFTGSIPPEIF